MTETKIRPLGEAIADLEPEAQQRWSQLLQDKQGCSWLANSVKQCPQCGHPIALIRWKGYELRCQRWQKRPCKKDPEFAPCGWKLKIDWPPSKV